jgi:hypothetical protein
MSDYDEAKYLALVHERVKLVERSFLGTLSPDEAKTLNALEAQLEQIDARRYGPALDELESRVNDHEKKAAALAKTVEWLRHLAGKNQVFPPPAFPPQLDLVVPIRTQSMSNARLHWARKARIVKNERKAVALLWPKDRKVQLPCVVHLTRVSPRALDDDNLRGALKAVRDQVAAQIGVDDRDPRVTWTYAQARGAPKWHAVHIDVDGVPF